jgi:hypothetical protein
MSWSSALARTVACGRRRSRQEISVSLCAATGRPFLPRPRRRRRWSFLPPPLWHSRHDRVSRSRHILYEWSIFLSIGNWHKLSFSCRGGERAINRRTGDEGSSSWSTVEKKRAHGQARKSWSTRPHVQLVGPADPNRALATSELGFPLSLHRHA